MIKVTDESLLHPDDPVTFVETGEVVGTIQWPGHTNFKVIRFNCVNGDINNHASAIVRHAFNIMRAYHVQMTPELYKERVLEQYHDSVRTAQSLFNCAEKRAKEICAQMLEAVNAN